MIFIFYPVGGLNVLLEILTSMIMNPECILTGSFGRAVFLRSWRSLGFKRVILSAFIILPLIMSPDRMLK